MGILQPGAEHCSHALGILKWEHQYYFQNGTTVDNTWAEELVWTMAWDASLLSALKHCLEPGVSNSTQEVTTIYCHVEKVPWLTAQGWVIRGGRKGKREADDTQKDA